MKIFSTFFISMLSFLGLSAQCAAITVNTTTNPPYIGYVATAGAYTHYKLFVTSQLSNGNASILPLFRCGTAGLLRETRTGFLDGVAPNSFEEDCKTWPVYLTDQLDSTAIFRCLTTDDVFLQVNGYASVNCGGTQCVEFALTNLDIALTKFTANFSSSNQVCLNWELKNDGNQEFNTYIIQQSIDGVNFEKALSLTKDEAFKNNAFNVCLSKKSNYNYFRLLIQAPNGNLTISPIRKITSKLDVAVISDRLNNSIKILGLSNHINPTINIYNSFGQNLYSGAITSEKVSMPNLASGIYVVTLDSNEGHIVKSIFY